MLTIKQFEIVVQTSETSEGVSCSFAYFSGLFFIVLKSLSCQIVACGYIIYETWHCCIVLCKQTWIRPCYARIKFHRDFYLQVCFLGNLEFGTIVFHSFTRNSNYSRPKECCFFDSVSLLPLFITNMLICWTPGIHAACNGLKPGSHLCDKHKHKH